MDVMKTAGFAEPVEGVQLVKDLISKAGVVRGYGKVSLTVHVPSQPPRCALS
jgi:hypothetical protein